MKKGLLSLLVLTAMQAQAIPVTAEQMAGEWQCKITYADDEGKIFAMTFNRGTVYANGFVEGGARLAFNSEIIYRSYSSGKWWIDDNQNYVSFVDYAKYERDFSEETKALLEKDAEFKAVEEKIFQDLQNNENLRMDSESTFHLVKRLGNMFEFDVTANHGKDKKPQKAVCQIHNNQETQ